MSGHFSHLYQLSFSNLFSAPSQTPSGLTVNTLNTTQLLVATWSPMNLANFDGDFLGYTLEIVLLRKGLHTPTSGNRFRFELHPAVTRHEFVAEPGSEYQFSLLARNEHGTGPPDGPITAGK